MDPTPTSCRLKADRSSSDVRRRRGLKVKDFKVDPTHWTLLETGLDLGLETLTSEELTDCFDEVCPCEGPHDADALKKQRNRLRQLLRKSAPQFFQTKSFEK